jgi:signal transduction histidine kinase
MPEKNTDINIIVLIITLIFFVVTVFILLYILSSAKRKNRHRMEKIAIRQKFETELLQAEFEIQEHTRKNIAGDLHDNIGQLLSLTNMTLASIDLLQADKASQKIADTQNLVQRSIQELRLLSKVIHGEQVIRQGLVSAIEQEIRWLERNGHYTVILRHNIEDTPLADDKKNLLIFRLLQEAFNNIIKHAQADTVTVLLEHTNGQLRLLIEDNGKGFDMHIQDQHTGLGMQSMRNRTSLLQGTMSVNSHAGSGTCIAFLIPYL